MTKVSIIVPTYNVEQYLNECMNSIINQTLKDIEIICVDDGSSDSSGSILDEYASIDNRIKVIHKENGGYGKAMNVGLDNACGEYIGIVEPDDYILPEMYEVLYNKAKENDVDLIKADFYRFTGYGNKLKKIYNKLDFSGYYYNHVINPQEDQTPFRFIMNTWSGIYRRDFIEKFNIRHNETPGASFQDNGFWFQTFMFASRIYFLDQPFYMNRRDNPNSSVKNKEKVYCITKEYDFIKNIINSDIKLNKFLGVYWLKKFHNYVFNISRIDEKFHKEFMNTFVKEFQNAKDKNEIDFEIFKSDNLLVLLEQLYSNPSKFYRAILHKKSFLGNIFSIKNSNDNLHKEVTILGIQIKFKSKKLIVRRIKNLENIIEKISYDLKKSKWCIESLNNKINNLTNEIQEQKNNVENIKIENKSIKSWQQNFYKDIPNEFPVRLSDIEKQTICKYLKDSDNYLEFGSGGSTFLALENSNTNVFSVESDQKWLDYLLSYKIINIAQRTQRLKFYPINIGEIRDWGYPINDDLKENYPNYSAEIFEKIDCKSIDTCLIDGRFRVACAIQTIINCPNIKYLMIHDYTFREYYHIIEEFLDIVDTTDTLVIFVKKSEIKTDKLNKLYEKYKYVKE